MFFSFWCGFFPPKLQEAARNNNGKAAHSKWRNYDDFNEYFWYIPFSICKMNLAPWNWISFSVTDAFAGHLLALSWVGLLRRIPHSCGSQLRKAKGLVLLATKVSFEL